MAKSGTSSISPAGATLFAGPQSLADEILAAIGPTPMQVLGDMPPALAESLAAAGCDLCFTSGGAPQRRETILLADPMAIGEQALEGHLQGLRYLVGRNLVILPASAAGRLSRTRIEDAAIRAGYRRHPGAFSIDDFERNNFEFHSRPVILELIPEATLAKWSLVRLGIERDLHMDMTREAGARADAHLVRYSLAAEWIRPGDSVLDCACGLGYGTAVLAARSPGNRFCGVDIDPASIDYARDNFGGWGAEYLSASATRLDVIPDRSMDVVVSFETMEHLEDYQSFVSEAARVLRPDGRIIVSVPNMWADKTGRDPNPHHHHVFDFDRCRAALESHFQVVARYSQTAPGGTKLLDARRSLRQHPLPPVPPEPETEWWIVVATAASNAEGSAAREAPVPQCNRSETCFAAGIRALMKGDDLAARQSFAEGLAEARHEFDGFGVGSDADLHPMQPAAFAARLMSAGHCARALDVMHLFHRSPGLFWRQVHPMAHLRHDPFHAETVASELEDLERLCAENRYLHGLTRLRSLLPLRLREIFLVIVPRAIGRIFGRRA